MRVIGLTGNIACGKSTVARMLVRLGAEVIDADVIAHEVMAPGTDVWRAVVAQFGQGILRPDGTIDRSILGSMVFADPAALKRLEEIVHPAVIQIIESRIAASKATAVVIEAIKMIESGLYKRCDSLWVVTCHPEQQLSRLMAQKGLTTEESWLRIKAQSPPEEKVRLADIVIDNSGTKERTWHQVWRAWTRECSTGNT
ncbi:MAG: dephospho-CoA kinase [Chloroflexi bacterium]|nr:dephospho-CoA kinase [Chloroflexota bacterium]MCL5076432.1 dephospho-CoA kinase [Chloroflexota bacterium]